MLQLIMKIPLSLLSETAPLYKKKGAESLPCVRVRVSGGHLCKAEAPTEAAAETVAAVWLTEGLYKKQSEVDIVIY